MSNTTETTTATTEVDTKTVLILSLGVDSDEQFISRVRPYEIDGDEHSDNIHLERAQADSESQGFEQAIHLCGEEIDQLRDALAHYDRYRTALNDGGVLLWD